MFCSICGKSVNENLNYCNNCGAKIGKNALEDGNHSSPFLSIAVGLIGTAGLFGFIMMLKILLESRLDQPSILIILIAYLVTLFLICAVLVGHIWKQSGDFRININQPPEDYAPPKEFRGGNTNQLEPPREPFIGSVTDNTTRTLDKVESKL
jgi:uncharacterized protein (DUF983 family)